MIKMDDNKKDFVNEAVKPSIDDLKAELQRENRKKEYGKTFRNTIFVLIVVAAAAVLVFQFFYLCFENNR